METSSMTAFIVIGGYVGDVPDPILYMILGACIGSVLGWLWARDQINKKLDDLRDKTEDRARQRAQKEVREELTDSIRRELVQEYTEEAKEEAQTKAERIISEAEDDAEGIVKNAEIEARNVLSESRAEAEEEVKQRRQELQKIEDRHSRRESKLDSRAERLDERDKGIQRRSAQLDEQQQELKMEEANLEEREEELEEILEELSEYSAEEARQKLEEKLIDRAELEASQRIREIEQAAEESAKKRAARIVGVACQRYAGDYVTEKCVNVIDLPSDDMKGRIIGREGRNIRAFEAITGTDVIVDDTPEVVVVSCFDPVRREIACRALRKLIADGRIHPARVEEVVEKTDRDVAQVIKDAGEKAALELGIYGLHEELIETVGKLKFRTSYGQNMWSHSIEVGFLCGLMAGELGVEVDAARRAGLLHDIGKAFTHENKESHALVGAELAERHGEKEVVRNAIAAHHNEEPQESVIAHLVIAADSLSGARPGARREVLGAYVKRLEELERISASFEGVKKSYAIQAGREIRVMVEHGAIDDDDAQALSRDIARRIEDELTYPGQIKVTVIRETRATEYAR